MASLEQKFAVLRGSLWKVVCRFLHTGERLRLSVGGCGGHRRDRALGLLSVRP